MATRSESFRARSERNGSASKKASTTPKAPRAKRAAARNARIKTDAPLNIREELTKGSPEERYRKSRARSSRARGS